MTTKLFHTPKNLQVWICLFVVTAVSFFTYFYNYNYPPYLFWDENYHIASAQKYLNGTFFMEPHPPLGKLFIALGEKILKPNSEQAQFLGTHYINIKDLPEGFSFSGYRLMSTLFAWLAAPLFFLIFFLITRNALLSAFLSSLYVFDNAIIVHCRAAMLEGSQIFFVAAMILLFLVLLRLRDRPGLFVLSSMGFGVCFGALMATKVNSLVMVILLPALFLGLWPAWKRFLLSFSIFCVSAAIVYVSVWQIHFSVCTEINPALENHGYFKSSAEYREILAKGTSGSLRNFPIMFRDSIRFFQRYSPGVPRLNLCKDNENGSPFFYWPVGARSINYRWQREQNGKVRYLYLQANPVIWWCALLGMLVGVSLLISNLVSVKSEKFKNPLLLITFVGLWVGYLVSVSRVTRVLYLYHYFLPLLAAFIVLSLVLLEVDHIWRFGLTDKKKTIGAGLLSLCSFGTFLFYSPLTYYQPISNEDLAKRAILGTWDLRCAGCARTNNVALSVEDKKDVQKKKGALELGTLRAYGLYQDWGDPQMNKTVQGKPLVVNGKTYERGFGVHAQTFMRFRLQKRFKRFSSHVGLPDYLKDQGGSTVFSVFGDKKLLWQSGIIHPGEVENVDVAVKGVKVLELEVSDAGDGIDYDHACWLNPEIL